MAATKWEALKEPFEERDLEWRVQMAGIKNGKPWARVLAYVDARAVQNRLDEVVGPENWQVTYERKEAGFLCHLAIKTQDGWVDKSDGSEDTDIEPFKGGISKALVRAASVWGIGRYLYDRDTAWANFVDRGTPGAREVKIENQFYYWLPPVQDVQPVPAQAPEVTASSPSNPVNEFGDFIVPFGKKFKGMRVRDMGAEQAFSYADFLTATSKKDSKPLTGPAKVLVEAINKFYGGSASQAQEPVVEDLPF